MHKISDGNEAPDRVLRLHMEGVDDLGGDVRLGSFIDKLAALKAALVETEHLVSGQTSTSIDFLVSELTHSSPAMVGLKAVHIGHQASPALDPAVVVHEFMSFLSAVRARTVEVTSQKAKLVGHLRKLVSGVGDRYARLWLEGPSYPAIYLDEEISKALDHVLPDIRRELGSVKGVVKRYSGVGKQPYFKIVPPVGGVEIKCVFPPEMLAQAAAAVERNATVEGELKYYEDDFWPHEVRVQSIAVHSHDAELPTLTELVGSDPNATGDLNSVDFLRELRNGW